MKEGDDEAASPLERALRYRDGLLLALLLHRPLRVSNLAAIRIDRHLVTSGAGYSLQFEGSEMKSHRPYECSVPQRLVRPFKRYLTEFRPVLAASEVPASGSDQLWIALGGAPLKPQSVAAVVRRRTRAVLAAGIGPHRVRHMVATLIAEDAPERTADISTVLGHLDPTTSEQHYIHARAGRAVGRLDDAITALRAKAAL